MKLKRISAMFSVIIAAALFTVYFTSVGYTSVQSNSAMNAALTDSTTTPVYTCSMHPEVISDKPGKCPKCGMELILKEDKDKSMNMDMNGCMDKCKDMGCNTDNCKGDAAAKCKGCESMKDGCPMMKMDKSNEHDHNSNDSDHNSSGHQHKSGCKKGC